MSMFHNKFSMICLLFSLYVVSCATPLPRDSSVNIPEDFFGMIGFTKDPKSISLLEEMEVKWVLRTLYWNSIENKRGEFDFSDFDDILTMVHDKGINIIGILGYQAVWLYPEGKSKKYVSAENIPYFLRYVEETVSHFKGKISAWQIWNEPNHIFWKGSNKDFYQLSKLTAQKIREIDPDVQIIGGVFMRAPKGFIKGMHKAGAMENLDGLVFHPYALNPWDSMKVYDKFLRVLSQINFSGSAWISEMGYPTRGWYPHKTTLKKLPSFLVKTAVGAATRGARVFVWYELFDSNNKGEEANTWNSEDYFGLVYPNYERKDAAWAYELCARYLAGSRYTSELPLRENIPAHIVSFCFLDGASGNNTLILWNDHSQTKKIALLLPTAAFLHDIASGGNRPLTEESVLFVGSKPLIITWQGADIPLLCIKK